METVYIVDPDSAIRDALATLLGSFDISVEAYPDAETFLRAVQFPPTGCVLSEVELPGLNGLGLLRELRRKGSPVPVVLITSDTKPGFVEQVRRAGAAGVLEKPFIGDDLVNRLHAVVGDDTFGRLVLSSSYDETLSDGTRITIRPIRPIDRQLEQSFVRSLSPISKHYRFFSGVAELSDHMLDKFTHMHYPGNVAIVATISCDNVEEEIGVARYAMTGESTAEFAVAVADEWQGRGIGTHLLQRLLVIARQAGITNLVGIVLRDNQDMLALARHLDFTMQGDNDDVSMVRVSKNLARDVGSVNGSWHAIS